MFGTGLVVKAKGVLRKHLRRAWENEIEFLDGFLRNVTGVMHVGANLGQEREFYRVIGVDVVWIEPIQEVYDKLVANIANFKRQRAILALVTDKDGAEYDFQIANNNGASSSILPMDKHAELWPDIKYVETRRLKGITLQTLMRRERLSTRDYQALVMDVEGAEMMVLKGAGAMLSKFQYIKAEVADFTPRSGSAVTHELHAFLEEAGFEELIRRPFADHPTGGTYWDIVWNRKPLIPRLHRPKIKKPIFAQDVSGVGWDKVGN